MHVKWASRSRARACLPAPSARQGTSRTLLAWRHAMLAHRGATRLFMSPRVASCARRARGSQTGGR
eukprot:7387484-Prymnesium_polylepis.2